MHHLLVPRIEKIFEPKFIYDSYACRKGKGTHAAVMRLKHFMNRVTRGGRVAAWFMQLDIRSFFMSIDREILLGILEKNVRKESYNNNPLTPFSKGEYNHRHSLLREGEDKPKQPHLRQGNDNPLTPFSKGEYANETHSERGCSTSNLPIIERSTNNPPERGHSANSPEKGRPANNSPEKGRPANNSAEKGRPANNSPLKKGDKGGCGFSNALLRLAEIIIRQDCTKDYIYKGDPELLQRIPPHKSLFHIPEGKGLPIGNLTSQFFGNAYLNELDQFVKHKLKARYYLRYVDDFILIDTDRERLIEMKEQIGRFLNEKLALELKNEFYLKRVSEGADFLGYIVRPDYVLVRNRVIGNLRARLRAFEAEMVVKFQSGKGSKCQSKDAANITHNPLTPFFKGELDLQSATQIIHLREENVRQLRQTLASYLGHFKYADAYKLTRSLFEKYGYLKYIFALNDEGQLIPVYEPSFEPTNMRRQYRWAVEQYSGHCIFFQVGKFCEFYGEQAEQYGKFLGLKIRTVTRMGMGTLKGLSFPLVGNPVNSPLINLPCSTFITGHRGLLKISPLQGEI